MVRRNDTRKWQLRQWHGRLRPREAKRSSGAGASSEELDAGRWPELAPLLEVLDFDAVAQLAQCSTSWREAMDAWRASTPHVACTSDALRRARGYSDGAVDSEVARDFLLHLSRLYPALQVVECAAHLSLATAHVQRVEARVEVKIATARELTRGCPKLHSLLVPTWSFPAAAVLQLGRALPLRALEVGTVPTWTKAPNVAGRSLQDFAKTSPRLESFRCPWLTAADAHLVAVAQSWPHLASLALPGCASLTEAGLVGALRACPSLEFIEVASALERKTVANLQQARPPAHLRARARPLPCGRLTPSPLVQVRSGLVMRHDSKKLHIKVEAMGDEIIFICKEATAMHKLMNAFCQRQGVPRSSTRFWYNQQRIEDYHTPGALGINDGDLVDVSVSGAQ